ncbi:MULTISPECIES: hypothetical protein [unclassified Mammaliicoccus]|uniref:hypothetical protein n=1 Tax=unclassified Mammaliicoccus TaxID=2803851 RepID=UPI001EFA78BF|nr:MULTISPECIES: hypothetical protein [unclassified Mammaliicoccus]
MVEHIKLNMFEDGQELFVITREEIESYLEEDDFNGFIVINKIATENKINIYKRKKSKNTFDTEGDTHD